MDRLKRNNKIRAAGGMCVIAILALIIYLPISQQFLYDKTYLRGGGGTTELPGNQFGYFESKDGGYSGSTVTVSCPENPNRKPFSTDPRYDPAKGKIYCDGVRDEFRFVYYPYLIPALLSLLFSIFLFRFLKPGRSSLTLNQEVAAQQKKRQQRRHAIDVEKGR